MHPGNGAIIPKNHSSITMAPDTKDSFGIIYICRLLRRYIRKNILASQDEFIDV